MPKPAAMLNESAADLLQKLGQQKKEEYIEQPPKWPYVSGTAVAYLSAPVGGASYSAANLTS